MRRKNFFAHCSPSRRKLPSSPSPARSRYLSYLCRFFQRDGAEVAKDLVAVPVAYERRGLSAISLSLSLPLPLSTDTSLMSRIMRHRAAISRSSYLHRRSSRRKLSPRRTITFIGVTTRNRDSRKRDDIGEGAKVHVKGDNNRIKIIVTRVNITTRKAIRTNENRM